MNDLMLFMYWSLFAFVIAWIAQLGAHPNSARASFAAIVMTISVCLIVGSVALTILNLMFRAWGA